MLAKERQKKIEKLLAENGAVGFLFPLEFCGWIKSCLQNAVYSLNACHTFFGGGDNLYLFLNGRAVRLRQSLVNKTRNSVGNISFSLPSDEEEIAVGNIDKRRSSFVDPMGVSNDEALLRLTEYLC